MTTGGLEAGYRRLLRCYPSSYRARHGEEILGVLMAAAEDSRRRPGARDSLDLVWSALKIRFRMVVRGAADSEPWTAALALVGVLLPLLMLLLKLTAFLDRGAQYGFGTPADLLIGAYGEPGSFTGMFHANPYSAALTYNVTQMLTAGPVPALAVAALAWLGWRRAAAAVTASVLLAYLGLTLTSGYFLLGNPRVDVTLYAYGLETLILLITPGVAARGWRALAWRPGALLATATVAAGIGMYGGMRELFYRPRVPALGSVGMQRVLASLPHGFIGRLFGVGPGQWGNWLLYRGTLVAVIAVALVTLLVSSPVNRRVLSLFVVPFALGLSCTCAA